MQRSLFVDIDAQLDARSNQYIPNIELILGKKKNQYFDKYGTQFS